MSASTLPATDAPFRMLFVCTANIARSAYAARRAAQLAAPGLLVTDGAGIPGHPGRGLDPEFIAILRARGCDHQGHVSRRLDAELLESADLVLTMELAHQLRIYDAWPEYDSKVFGLVQFAEAVRTCRPGYAKDVVLHAFRTAPPNSVVWDVPDPYRNGTPAANAVANAIDDALRDILPALSLR